MKSFSFRKLEPNEGEMLGEIAFFGDLEVAGFYEHFCFREGGERHIHTANVNAKVISALSVWILSNLNSFHQNLAPNFVNHIASNTTNFEINQELLISPSYVQFYVELQYNRQGDGYDRSS